MIIELATKLDLPNILAIYSNARAFMVNNGNKDQWGSSWPKEEALKEDISLSRLFVIKDNNDILGVFALIKGSDPCYLDIEGSWLNDNEYITIHRLASSFTYKGIFHLVIEYIKHNYPNLDIRIDTHKNNTPMIKAILKEGFIYTGIIYVNNDTPHSPRNAYQLVIK